MVDVKNLERGHVAEFVGEAGELVLIEVDFNEGYEVANFRGERVDLVLREVEFFEFGKLANFRGDSGEVVARKVGNLEIGEALEGNEGFEGGEVVGVDIQVAQEGEVLEAFGEAFELVASEVEHAEANEVRNFGTFSQVVGVEEKFFDGDHFRDAFRELLEGVAIDVKFLEFLQGFDGLGEGGEAVAFEVELFEVDQGTKFSR